MKLTDEMIRNYKSNLNGYSDCEEICRKTYSGKAMFSKFEVTDGEREFVATINTNSVDRDSEIVDPKGMNIKNFLKNPVIMLQHESWELPIGRATWLKKFYDDGMRGIVAKGRIADSVQRAVDTFELMQQGILTTTSIGFGVKESRAPTEKEIEANPELKGVTRIITKSELFEFSIVAVPSNIDATIHAVSKMPSWITGKEAEPVDMREILPTPVELKEPIRLESVIHLTEVHDIDEVMTQDKIIELVEKEHREIYEARVLGKV